MQRLELHVLLEDQRSITGLDLAQFGELVAGLGPGCRWLVAERPAANGLCFAQTLREDDGRYLVEHRDGDSKRHFAVRLSGADEVVDFFRVWATDDGDWRTAHPWERLRFEPVPALEPGVLAEVENAARQFVRQGFQDAGRLAQSVSEYFDPAAQPVSIAQAAQVVARVWDERLAEEAAWPEVTEPDRIERAFDALEANGITARMDFACCGNCAHGEIGAEARPGARGYVFFHHQDTEHAADGRGLWLTTGFLTITMDRAAITAEVADALRAQGLASTEPHPGLLRLDQLDWRKRLPR